jgi:hypothetical protein
VRNISQKSAPSARDFCDLYPIENAQTEFPGNQYTVPIRRTARDAEHRVSMGWLHRDGQVKPAYGHQHSLSMALPDGRLWQAGRKYIIRVMVNTRRHKPELTYIHALGKSPDIIWG